MPFKRKSFCHKLTPSTEKYALSVDPELLLGLPTGAVEVPAASCGKEVQLRPFNGRSLTV